MGGIIFTKTEQNFKLERRCATLSRYANSVIFRGSNDTISQNCKIRRTLMYTIHIFQYEGNVTNENKVNIFYYDFIMILTVTCNVFMTCWSICLWSHIVDITLSIDFKNLSRCTHTKIIKANWHIKRISIIIEYCRINPTIKSYFLMLSILMNNLMILTVIVQHEFSLMAPQHPKNAITKIRHPKTKIAIGTLFASILWGIFDMLPILATIIDPKTIRSIPHTYKIM